MIISQITYKRIHNLGNYENQELSATALIGDDENPIAVFEGLRAFVEARLFDGEQIKNKRRNR